MIHWRRLVLGLIGFSFFAGIVRADMVTVFKLGAEQQRPIHVCSGAEVRHTNLSCLYDSPIVDGFSLGTVHFLPKARVDMGQSTQMPPAIELTDGPGSASLCLYALMGLGLYSAPHWIRRLSMGLIPEWYHDEAPFQIGHSFAVPPESLCPVPVYCFVQPDDRAERFIPQYRLRTVVSLWRKSQFTPDVIASRGPPNMP